MRSLAHVTDWNIHLSKGFLWYCHDIFKVANWSGKRCGNKIWDVFFSSIIFSNNLSEMISLSEKKVNTFNTQLENDLLGIVVMLV